jgi:O-antigen/teichoic acid export membrane protein
LARWLAPEQYGAYALAFSIFVLVAFLYQALLLEPLSVFSGTTYRGNLRGYLKATVWIHWGISIVVCLLLGATAWAAWAWWHSALSAMAFAGLTIATPFILIHALGRRSFYLKLSPAPAAFGSVFYCVLVTAGVFVAYRQGWLTSFTAYLVMGLASLVGGIIMLFQLNARLEPTAGQVELREAWRKHWEYGKWALGTCIVGWIPNYVYIPLVSSSSGMTAAGELRALMNFAAPLLQTYAALSMLFLPYAARVQSKEGRRSASALSRKLALLFLGFAPLRGEKAVANWDEDSILGRADSVAPLGVSLGLCRQVCGIFVPGSVLCFGKHAVERGVGTGNFAARGGVAAVPVFCQRRGQRNRHCFGFSGNPALWFARRGLEYDSGESALHDRHLRTRESQTLCP